MLNPVRSALDGNDKLFIQAVRTAWNDLIKMLEHIPKTQRRAVPQGQASRSEHSIVFGRYQMPPKIEKIVDDSVRV